MIKAVLRQCYEHITYIEIRTVFIIFNTLIASHIKLPDKLYVPLAFFKHFIIIIKNDKKNNVVTIGGFRRSEWGFHMSVVG